jgi:hypothetical protein
MFRVVLLTTGKSVEATQMPLKQGMNRHNEHTHAVEYDLPTKKKRCTAAHYNVNGPRTHA